MRAAPPSPPPCPLRWALLVALVAAACTVPRRAGPGALAAREPGAGGLAAALASVDAARVEADVRFLAAPELAGRDTPSPGLDAAAAYLEAGARAAGLAPGAEGSYRARYELVDAGLDAERSGAELSVGAVHLSLRPGRDYAVRSGEAHSLDAAGPVRFVGRGGRDELAGLAVEGAWVLAWDSELAWSRRALYARRAGALGVLVAPDPQAGSTGPPAWARESLLPAPRRPAPRRAEPAPFPAVWIAPRALASALALADRDADALRPGEDLGIAFRETRRPRGTFEAHNVAALWPGRDPLLAGELVVLLAHYDHVGVRDGHVHPGADDNASGTAALLAVARGLAAGGPLRRSVLLLWVSGEERGLLGSRAWAEDPPLAPGLRPVAAVNLDMVGRNAPDHLSVTPSPRHEAYNDVVRVLEALAHAEGFLPLARGDDGWLRSDHYALHVELGVPVASLSSDEHADYHRPSDTADRVDVDKVARVARLLLRGLWALDARDSLGSARARVPASAQ